ncbi:MULTISPECIES: 4-oxalocrotonate tautomerase [Aeribacillus]|uniref:4-oxalocrotonate tautomerase n=1 Tax=Aeribacillus TaxID=1055323 RepID=UPI00214FC9A3|nr:MULTISPECIES: 4-oxalocrotonate tautomerase [Aeribacillus]MDR9797416.1 4-oxalocrotonate tautomerase [Aeribacillus pallidus]MED0701221.1 4-oxalocrotonate tautomerase [Aeribacillus composti]MED0714648.1 4-oxalocrotonate tautomerase [Aeribacillus composti]MED0744653.1 4-oxalocrotonate tautomerase [Aeribacillus composti]MED1439625.1 4-oxalocrotonate tautomerase [Aeribacillus composti]
MAKEKNFLPDRRDDMPFVTIQIMEGRPPEKIKELIQNVTNTVSETLDSPKENIRVLVTEVPKTHWGIAGKPASEVRK